MVTLLAPTFLAAAGSNSEFGLAALDPLNQSMLDDISVPVTLRLRGNAIGCSRSAQQTKRR